ncbi:MAG: cyclic nucleotide-binding domain-containing protein [Pseudomonadota bacterium]
MATSLSKTLPVVRLNYEPGETIVKAGDYGISIYQVIEGEVTVFTGPPGDEVNLATIGPGEVLGEMLFMTGDQEPRSASARAVTQTVLDAWHPSRIQQEYDEMPFVIRHIANQTVSHLKQMNRMLAELATQKDKPGHGTGADTAGTPEREFRKEVSLDCLYRPSDSPETVKLWGKIRNISLEGLRIEVKQENAAQHHHGKGSMFICSFFLPKGKRFTFRMAVVNSMVQPDNQTLSFGSIFIGLSDAHKRVLSAIVG